VKLPSARFVGIPENEYAMMTLARKLGMDIPEIKLVPLEQIVNLPQNLESLKGPALAVKRFDRTPDGSVHIEDFAQVFGVYPDQKYEMGSYKNIAEVIGIETGETGIAEFIRRLVFNTLVGNADMHLKNWSLIYPDKKTSSVGTWV
jgi:serine/threonine-protein kinase HipA